ncbi:MAG TPA: ATP-binding protein [Longimicrobium sp.]|nr:ATP-binding protein [Longimicrobium sp.]
MSRPLRVVVTGSESTGKTTLAARLAAHYGTPWTPEFARTYVDALARPLTRGDVEPIARGQLAGERDAVPRAGRLLVLDTDVLSTLVYGEHYYGHAPGWIAAALRRHPADLYLLCDVDAPWVPDPQRDRGDARDEMHALFAAAVRRTGVPTVLVRGDWDQRFRTAVAAVDALLAAHSDVRTGS